MFSEKDREIVLHIRKLFSKDGKMPEYHEESNTIILAIDGEGDIHPLFISCLNTFLRIESVKGIHVCNCSEKFFRRNRDHKVIRQRDH